MTVGEMRKAAEFMEELATKLESLGTGANFETIDNRLYVTVADWAEDVLENDSRFRLVDTFRDKVTFVTEF
jgi:hypothetical protein